MAVGMRALLDTVMQALPQVAGRWGGQKGRDLREAGWRASSVFSVSFPLLQVGNLGLLFMLLFFIFAALGVELFGDLGELRFRGGGGGRGGEPEGS